MPKLIASALFVSAVLASHSLCAADAQEQGEKGPKTVSEQQAAAEAKDNRKLANRLWDENLKACKAKDFEQLEHLAGKPYQYLNAQPTNNLKYRARFAYDACRNMLDDVAALNGACQSKSTTEYGWNRIEQRWGENSSNCSRQIAHPDLSYDEPEPSESELVQQLKDEGKSEADIEFIRELHKL